jgi:hypothetical protein
VCSDDRRSVDPILLPFPKSIRGVMGKEEEDIQLNVHCPQSLFSSTLQFAT